MGFAGADSHVIPVVGGCLSDVEGFPPAGHDLVELLPEEKQLGFTLVQFILMLVGVANIMDVHVIGTGSALRGAVICFYLSNEGVLAS